MVVLRGILRITSFGILLFIGTILVLLTSMLPVREGQVPPAAKVVSQLARIALNLFNVTVSCDRPERIARHDGLLFANHLSYLDIPILLHFGPLRFLAKQEVSSYFLVGWIARSIGTIFVLRGDKRSRSLARERLREANMFPALVIFVEGETGPGGRLLPFRYGAFDIAIQTGRVYLPCAIIHNREDIVVRDDDETLLASIWRLACFQGGVKAHVAVLDAVTTRQDDDARLLSLQTHAAMLKLLPYPAQQEER